MDGRPPRGGRTGRSSNNNNNLNNAPSRRPASRRGGGGAQQPQAAAPAAAAAGDNSNDNNIDDPPRNGGDGPTLDSLVRALRDIARHGGYDPQVAVDRNRVRIMLEAVGGDMDMAATLYWDDFMANHHLQQQQQPPQNEEQPPVAPAVRAAVPVPPPRQQRPAAAPRIRQDPPRAGRRPPAAAPPPNDAPRPVARGVRFQRPPVQPGRAAPPPVAAQLPVAQQPQQNDHPDGNVNLDVARNRRLAAAEADDPFERFNRYLANDDASPMADGRLARRRGQSNNNNNNLDSDSDDTSLLSLGGPRAPDRPEQQHDGEPPGRRQPIARAAAAAARALQGNDDFDLSSSDEDEGGGAAEADRRRRQQQLLAPNRNAQPAGEAPMRRPGLMDLDWSSSGDDEDVEAERRHRRQRLLLAMAERRRRNRETVSVSDDEAAGGTRNRTASRLAQVQAAAAPPPPQGSLVSRMRQIAQQATSGAVPSAAEAAGAALQKTLPRRRKRQHPSQDPKASNENDEMDVDDPVSSSRKVAKPQDDKPKQEDLVDGYLSDNDWIWEGFDRTLSNSAGPVAAVAASKDGGASKKLSGPPTDLLWGLPSAAAKFGETDEQSNVIVDDTAGSDDARNNSTKTGIPRTWLSAGFHLSECGTALCVNPPSEDDLAYFAWQQLHQRNIPPPYHCRSLTAILSIVTATVVTGASLQAGHVVTTSTSRTPFLELTPEERKRQFESRLADALTSLLWVAVKASVARKKKALLALYPQMSSLPSPPSLKASKTSSEELANDPHQRQVKLLKRKLDLVPTCRWDVDPTTGDVRIEDDTQQLKVCTSFTHKHDLKCYVLSHMRFFTSSGGVALFLETILKIHGKGTVRRMLEQAAASRQHLFTGCQPCSRLVSEDSGPITSSSMGGATGGVGLIRCTCDERHAKELRSPRTGQRPSSSTLASMDTTPPGTDCMSVEFISLLLTGKVHSSWQGWDTGPLEFGFLISPTVSASTNRSSSLVGKALSRPKQPVWILQGPTCYSVLWMSGSHDNAASFAYRDVVGAVGHMTHWNTWYGPQQRRKTTFRLSVGRHPEASSDNVSMDEADATTTERAASDVPKTTKSSTTLQLLKQRRLERDAVNEARLGPEPFDPELLVTPSDLERIQVHEQDQKLYPQQYKMWRFDLDVDDDTDEAASLVDDVVVKKVDRKMHATRWIPYHRLSDRHKRLVETKFGPAIRTILLTRWPRSSQIDRFQPNDPPPIV